MANYRKIVQQYCDNVLSNKAVAGKFQKLAVKRYQSDLENCLNRGLYLDEKAAIKSIRFFEFLKHSKGEFAGQSFELLPWQIFVLWNLFGWKISIHPTNQKHKDPRRYNYAYIEVARKNGKSTFAAGIALYLADADNEPAAEVYCFATKEEQAKKTIFTEAANMVKKSPLLSRRLNVFTKSIYNETTLSFLQPLGSDSNTQDGLNTHGSIGDEYHAHTNDNMVNVIKSSTGARRNPLMLLITTAGFRKESACYKEREACIKILEGVLEQDNKFAMIFTLDKDDDWQNPAVWEKSNPSLSAITTLKKFLEKEYIDCQNNPSRVTNFKTKNLNVWTNAQQSFISDEKWMLCNQSPVEFEHLRGRQCVYCGLDLAKRVDINALLCLFTDKVPYDIYAMFWIPESKLQNNSDDVDYELWKQQGYLRILPGDSIDMELISEEIAEILSHFDVESVGIDRYMIEWATGKKLAEKGIELNGFGQGYVSMSAPTRELEAMVMDKQLNHGGNPVLRWMNSNVVIDTDPAGNIKMNKGKSKNKIDGMISLVMAIGEFLSNDDNTDINEYYKNLTEND